MATKKVQKITTQKKTIIKPRSAKKRPVVKLENAVIPSDGNLGNRMLQGIMLPPKVVAQIADQVAKAVAQRVPMPRRGKSKKKKSVGKVEGGFVLDTSAIIDGRIFDLSKIGVFVGDFVILSGVLDELKHIADGRDVIKQERGKRALRNLDDFKKVKDVKLIHIEDEDSKKPVDERIISYAKKNKGRILTCDFNLSKKARISDVASIDLYEMANILKTTAVPGEEFFVKIVQKGKGVNQGVGYLPDGTMLVVEQGDSQIGKTIKVGVSRVIQTDAGRIFFGKIIS